MLRTSAQGALIALVSLAALACTDAAHVELELSPSDQARLQRSEAPVAPQTARLADASLSFAMNKWLDAEGTTKASVAGSFTRFEVVLDRPLSGLSGIEELAGIGASVTVDLGSVATDLELRDDNIERAYFEATSFPEAVFRLKNARPTGEGPSGRVVVDGELDLHGFTVDLDDIALDFTRSDDGWLVASASPLSIRSDDFGMPVRALLQTCGHLGIDDAAELNVHFKVLDAQ